MHIPSCKIAYKEVLLWCHVYVLLLKAVSTLSTAFESDICHRSSSFSENGWHEVTLIIHYYVIHFLELVSYMWVFSFNVNYICIILTIIYRLESFMFFQLGPFPTRGFEKSLKIYEMLATDDGVWCGKDIYIYIIIQMFLRGNVQIELAYVTVII